MKKTVFTAGISILIGFSLTIGIANYIIPLFWERRLALKLGFLTAGTVILSIIAYLIIAWKRGDRHGVLKLAENLGELIKKYSNSFMLLYIVLVGIAVFALISWITTDGSGISPDSTIYLDTAKNLVKGAGFYALGVPLTHFPPLYPIFLAMANLLNSNIIQAAGLLNAILYAINIGLVAWAVFRASHNFIATTGAIFFFLTTSTFLNLHAIAYSEPLFMACTLACIILLAMYYEKPTLLSLVLSSVFLGMAMMTRYIGVVFLPAALIIIILGGIQLRTSLKIRNGLIFLVIACLPLVIWSIRNILVAGTVADRVVAFHPIITSKLNNFVTTLHDFILPIQTLKHIKILEFWGVIVFLIGVMVVFKKQLFRDLNWRSKINMIPFSCGLFSIFYLLGLFISLFFIDAYTPINSRILFPVLIFLTIGGFSVMWAISQKLKKPVLWWSFLILVVLSGSIKIPVSIGTAIDFRRNNYGYNIIGWRKSDTMAFVNSLPGDMRIYSNGFDILGLFTEKESLPLPEKINQTSQIINKNFQQEITLMCNDISQSGALIVFFPHLDWRTYFPTQAELASSCHLSVKKRLSDGLVLGTK